MNRLKSPALTVRRLLIALSLIATLFVMNHAGAQNGGEVQPAPQSATGESFAGTFFMSYAMHPNGDRSIDIVGSLLLWSLIALSVINFGLIGYLALANQRKTIFPEGVAAQTKKLLNNGDYRQALELTNADQSFFSQVLHAGLNEANHGLPAVIRSLEQAADLKITARMRPIEILYMFGQVSPMIGLLGTVYGIIYAFRVFVSMGGHASPALLAGGIGTALVATFWGLVVAIPALAGYSFLRNKVDQLTMQATMTAEELIGQFKPKSSVASTQSNPPSPKIAQPAKAST